VDDQYDDDSVEGVVVTGETLLTEADYLATWDAVPQFGAFKSVRVMLSVAALAGLPSLHFFGGSPVAWPVVVFPVLLVAALTFGFARGKRQFARNAVSDMGGGQISYRVSDEGFAVRTPRAKSEVAWESLAQQIERPGYFLVFTTPQQFVLVPQRAFSAEDVDTLRQMFVERIVKKPLRGAPRQNAGRTLVLWVISLGAFLALWQLLGR
jgi:YcxB-like protein